jgi:hypothetical protein
VVSSVLGEVGDVLLPEIIVVDRNSTMVKIAQKMVGMYLL